MLVHRVAHAHKSQPGRLCGATRRVRSAATSMHAQEHAAACWRSLVDPGTVHLLSPFTLQLQAARSLRAGEPPVSTTAACVCKQAPQKIRAVCLPVRQATSYVRLCGLDAGPPWRFYATGGP